jgi:uncharacterized protein (DUF2236 family)
MGSHQIGYTVVSAMDNPAPYIDPPPPDSVTARVNGARLSVLGWGRAILLQLAHPLVAAGVGEHSNFRGSILAPAARLHGTVRAMLAFTFGSPAEATAAASHINRIHDRVHGRLSNGAGSFPAGTPYSAHDPALLLWVHVTLLESMPLAYSRFVAPLDDDAVGAYCRESRRGAALVGIDPATVPDSMDSLRAMLTRIASEQLHVTPTARALAHSIVHPPLGSLLGPISQMHRITTIGLLPEHIRQAYDFEWTAEDERLLERWTGRLRAFARRAPPALTHWSAARRRRRSGVPDNSELARREGMLRR